MDGEARVPPLSRLDAPVVGDKRPLSIVWDHGGELPYAQALGRRLEALDPPQLRGADLRLLRASPKAARWYLSVSSAAERDREAAKIDG